VRAQRKRCEQTVDASPSLKHKGSTPKGIEPFFKDGKPIHPLFNGRQPGRQIWDERLLLRLSKWCSDTIATVWRLRQVGTSQRDEGRVVVVPTGFEPVFKDDYDFALYFCELRRFHTGRKWVRL